MLTRTLAALAFVSLTGSALASAQSFGGTLVYHARGAGPATELHLEVHGAAAVEIARIHHGLWSCVGSPVVCRTYYMWADGEQRHPATSSAPFGTWPVAYTSSPSGPAALMHIDPVDPDEWVFLLPVTHFAALNIPYPEHDPSGAGQYRVWRRADGAAGQSPPTPYHAEFGVTHTVPISTPSHFSYLTGWSPFPG